MENIDEEIRILPADIKYLDSYSDTINSVSKEGKYLSTSKGFSNESLRRFITDCAAKGYPAFFVVNEKDEAVGWCDIVERESDGVRTGSIGVGLRKDYRGAGIGRLLINRTLEAAVNFGFERIVLEVRKSNEHARHVYEQLNFVYDDDPDSMEDIDGEKTPVKHMHIDLVTYETEEDGEQPTKRFPYALFVCGGCIIGAVIAILCIIL